MDVVAVAGLVVSFFAGLIVSPLIAVVGERVRDWLFHPEIRALGAVSTREDPKKVTRLLLKNEGSVSAREAEPYVEEVFDGAREREDFIAVPLRWTHGQLNEGSRIVRDIHAGQQCHLDVVEVLPVGIANRGTLRLCAGAEWVHQHDHLWVLQSGRTDVVIAIYNASGRTTRVQLSVEWDGTWSAPEVSIVS